MRLILYAVIDENTDQDAGGVETPTAMEDDKLVTQELQNSIVINIPIVDQFSHVNQLSEIVFSSFHHRTFYIGGRLPPILEKLVRRIQDVRFISMATLLPDNLKLSHSIDDDCIIITTKC